MSNDRPMTVMAAKMLVQAAEICRGKPSVLVSGTTVHCPNPKLLASAEEVLKADEIGEGIDAAMENFLVLLNEPQQT